MKKRNLFVISALLASSLAMAQTATPATASTTAPQPATSAVVSGKLTSEFSGWAGSTENADALVNGLRTGTAITLTSTGTGGTVTTTTFSPPTRPMGYGNIRIALLLAKTQLAGQGITDPTVAELQGALVGMPGSSTQGILQMRASGMGWGQIANSLGVKLGAVVSGKQIVTPTTAAGKSTSGSRAHTHKGAVSAGSGKVTTGLGHTHGQGAGAGVVNAGGSGRVTTGLGHAYGQGVGAGVVNAGGGKAAGVAGSNAGGNGKGGGKP
jgi:hypothetical protein